MDDGSSKQMNEIYPSVHLGVEGVAWRELEEGSDPVDHLARPVVQRLRVVDVEPRPERQPFRQHEVVP